MKVFGLYSAGGFAREVSPSLVDMLRCSGAQEFRIVFIDDDPSKIGSDIHGYSVVSFEQFCQLENSRINVAFADPVLRRKKVDLCVEAGLEFFSVIAPEHYTGSSVTVGNGAILARSSMITCDAVIGSHFHCNIFSYVAHDCVVGDFVTLAPRVSVNGRVTIKNGVYIGSDATVLPGRDADPLVIGEGAIIGAGAVVTRSVPAGITVVGNPARPISR